jgi:YesN/AraC family two-component response regulator
MQELIKLTKNLHILYVEDEESSRVQLSEIFELLFESVNTAFDGEDAYAKYQEKHYDIIITDINMPRMNGLELIKKIKLQNSLQNFIIISAHNNYDYLNQAKTDGVDNFIIKPLKMQQLFSVLTKVSQDIHRLKDRI